MGWCERLFCDGPTDAERAAMLADGGELAEAVPPRSGLNLTEALALGGLADLASHQLITGDMIEPGDSV